MAWRNCSVIWKSKITFLIQKTLLEIKCTEIHKVTYLMHDILSWFKRHNSVMYIMAQTKKYILHKTGDSRTPKCILSEMSTTITDK